MGRIFARHQTWAVCSVGLLLGLAVVLTFLLHGDPENLFDTPTPQTRPLANTAVREQPDSTTVTDRTPVEPTMTLRVYCAMSGTPVPGALVQIPLNKGRVLTVSDVKCLGETDADGVFSCPLRGFLAPFGTGPVPSEGVRDSGLRVIARGFIPQDAAVDFTAVSQVVRLAPAPPTEFRFEDREGKPIAGVRVLASSSPFEPLAPAVRDRVPAPGGNSAPRAIVGGLTSADGLIRLDGRLESAMYVYCDHPGYVALDPIWSGGGFIERRDCIQVVTMGRLSVAAAMVPSRRFLRCAFVEPPVIEGSRELIERVSAQRRALARAMEQPNWHVVSVARIDGLSALASEARLQVTCCDGSELIASLEYRSVEDLLRRGVIKLDLPSVNSDRVAYVEVRAVTPDGASLVGLPYTLRRVGDSVSPDDTLEGRPQTRLVDVNGRTGDPPYPVVAGSYSAEIAGRVVAISDVAPALCPVGATTTLTLSVREEIVPFRLRMVGIDGPYVSLLLYGVRDQQGRRVAGYAGSADGDEPQVWLPRGTYSIDVNLAGYPRRRVPIVIERTGDRGVMEVDLDPKP